MLVGREKQLKSVFVLTGYWDGFYNVFNDSSRPVALSVVGDSLAAQVRATLRKASHINRAGLRMLRVLNYVPMPVIPRHADGVLALLNDGLAALRRQPPGVVTRPCC